MNDSSNTIFALLGAGFIFFILFLSLILIISNWKIYQKAGQPGWACIIPIYNFLVLLRIINKPWWWIILMIIPLLNLIWAIWSVNLLSKSFGKSEGFTLGLLILPFIFYPILAFGDAKYIGTTADELGGFTNN